MKDPGRILVIQLRRIGDVILTTPAVAALKARWPRAELDFLVEPAGAEALAGNPHIHELIVYRARGPLGALPWLRRVRRKRYDWVIDFMGNPRTAFLTSFSGAAVNGAVYGVALSEAPVFSASLSASPSTGRTPCWACRPCR